jgi:hypothetical protein
MSRDLFPDQNAAGAESDLHREREVRKRIAGRALHVADRGTFQIQQPEKEGQDVLSGPRSEIDRIEFVHQTWR